MRLLLDESVPVRLRRFLPSHSVKTVVEMGWGGVRNGALLVLAAKEFDAFLTVDKNLPYRLPLVQTLEQARDILQPCTFIRVGV
jgi:hypothetical protein